MMTDSLKPGRIRPDLADSHGVLKPGCPGIPWRIHGAAIYGNMDPINIPPMLAYIPYMDPMGIV